MNIKKVISAVVLSSMVLGSVGLSGNAQEVTVEFDGKKIESSVPARIENGRTMVPMRAIFESFGMEVDWNDEEKSVTATDGKNTIKLTIGSSLLFCNGEATELDVAPYIDGGTTLIPVRAVSESLDAEVEWNDEKKKVEIETESYKAKKDAWKENLGSVNLSDMTVSGEGLAVEGNVIRITKGGDFEITGENDNAMIHVDATEKVKLRLEGIKLTNPSGPAIFFENSEKSLITISKGTENFVSDTGEYSVDAKAAIFSNDDIEIKGEGTLNVTSKNYHALASDDDIKIEEGTIILNAEAKDGIHANNEIKIKGGKISVTAYGDGIQAEENIVIEGGEINVTTTGEVASSMGDRGFGGGAFGQGGFGGSRGNRDRVNGENMRPEGGMPTEDMTMPEEMKGMFSGSMPPEGMKPAHEMMPMEDMTMPEEMKGMFDGFMPPEGGMPPMENNGFGEAEETATEDETTATKGIKAEIDITVSGGKITINSADHAIHSAGTVNITGGEMVLKSDKGKGISAHGNVVIDNGTITVEKASEGLESKADFTINGGKISVTASDDGINAGGTGGRDVASRWNPDAETEHDLIINGGEIFVNASGDGVDANGRMIINGGNIIVEGPTNNGNGALDSGGVISVNGGTLIALGASGMAETPGNESKQASFRLVTETNIPTASLITIKNAKGEEIYSYTTVKTGNSVVFSSDKLTVGESYTVTIGETEYSIEMTNIVTSSGNGGFGGFGGRRPW